MAHGHDTIEGMQPAHRRKRLLCASRSTRRRSAERPDVHRTARGGVRCTVRGGGRGYEFNKCAATIATWTLCAAGELENCTRTSSERARRCPVTILLRTLPFAVNCGVHRKVIRFELMRCSQRGYQRTDSSLAVTGGGRNCSSHATALPLCAADVSMKTHARTFQSLRVYKY